MSKQIIIEGFAVEIFAKYNDGFLRQIDAFDTYEEAYECCRKHKKALSDDIYLAITTIYCDENENEIGIETVAYNGG